MKLTKTMGGKITVKPTKNEPTLLRQGDWLSDGYLMVDTRCMSVKLPDCYPAEGDFWYQFGRETNWDQTDFKDIISIADQNTLELEDSGLVNMKSMFYPRPFGTEHGDIVLLPNTLVHVFVDYTLLADLNKPTEQPVAVERFGHLIAIIMPLRMSPSDWWVDDSQLSWELKSELRRNKEC